MSDEVGFGLRLELLRHTYSVRPGDDDVPALGLLTVAEGLAEVIALLRPLVDAAAQPEPLLPVAICAAPYTEPGSVTVTCAKVLGHDGQHADGRGVFWRTEVPKRMSVLCLAGDPSSGGVRRCTEPLGHDGDHVHRPLFGGEGPVIAWANDPLKYCGATRPGNAGVSARACELRRGHLGAHTDGEADGVTW